MESRYLGNVVLDQNMISCGVTSVADQLNHTFNDIVIVTVVPGGILFTADLVRQLKIDVSMDYISCPHRPGETDNSSRIVYHQNINIKGKDVVVVDDAIESGGTMKRLVAHLLEFNPKSISTATLFVKPGRVEVNAAQFFGYEMDNDDLLVGYGLPWEDKLRNIPCVYKLNSDVV